MVFAWVPWEAPSSPTALSEKISVTARHTHTHTTHLIGFLGDHQHAWPWVITHHPSFKCVCVCVWSRKRWLPCGWLSCQRADKNPERESVRPEHRLIDSFVSLSLKQNNITLTDFMFSTFYCCCNSQSIDWLMERKWPITTYISDAFIKMEENAWTWIYDKHFLLPYFQFFADEPRRILDCFSLSHHGRLNWIKSNYEVPQDPHP